MHTPLDVMRKQSAFILPAFLLVLTMGFATGMDVCTAIAQHHHVHHMDRPVCGHSEMSHVCESNRTAPSHVPACDTSSHRHIQISLASDSRLPESNAASGIRASQRVVRYDDAHVSDGFSRMSRPHQVSLAQHIRPVVLLI